MFCVGAKLSISRPDDASIVIGGVASIIVPDLITRNGVMHIVDDFIPVTLPEWMTTNRVVPRPPAFGDSRVGKEQLNESGSVSVSGAISRPPPANSFRVATEDLDLAGSHTSKSSIKPASPKQRNKTKGRKKRKGKRKKREKTQVQETGFQSPSQKPTNTETPFDSGKDVLG